MMVYRLTAPILLSLLLSGCNLAQRLSTVGDPPQLSHIQDPTLVEGYQPVSMPMPFPEGHTRKVNSLWETGSRAFFKDQRAGRAGDVLTVIVDLNDVAKFDSNPKLERDAKYTMNVPNFFGYESKFQKIFPNAVTPTPLINTNSKPSVNSKATYDRKDTVSTKIAATIIQVLPNGNMVIQGRQEIRVQNEVRELEVHGIIRREDITSGNTIHHSKIAEARFSYGGRGDISDMTSQPWGYQVVEKILPW
jgi:flagellar L-ring protein FlgH